LQKLPLTIYVRSHIGWALLWLIVSVIVSFIATKVLVAERRRINLQRQIHDMTPPWFFGLPATAPVVWVHAVLHLGKKLSSRFWLTSPDLIEAHVNGVRSMLKVLDQSHQLRDRLTRALDWLLLRRVLIGLEGALSRLEAGPPDDASATRIQDDLKAFEDWLTKDKLLTKFRGEVEPVMRSLVTEIASGQVPDGVAKKDIESLSTAVQSALKNPPQTTEEMEELYRKYARLSILWDQRDSQDLTALIQATDLQEFFRLADRHDWEYLKKALQEEKKRFSIHMPPSNSLEGLEAYVPLTFSVECDGLKVRNSYLFKHKVKYVWILQLKPKKRGVREKLGLTRQPQCVTLTPTSLGPSVVQYFPRGGEVEVSVALLYEGDREPGPSQKGLVIHDSSAFGFFQAFEKVEVASWLIATAVAIVTGLATFYYKGPIFGSFQDYLTLFLWGVGVDQGKNFLQSLQVFSSSTAVAPSAGH
jgi:hypothetical protein